MVSHENMNTRFGASFEDWERLKQVGLSAHLLPVVSNPHAAISSMSKLSEIGKVPSRYDGDRKVIGFPNWTSHHSNNRQVDAWSKEPDFGICVQTREIRAIDIDVDNEDQAFTVSMVLRRYLGPDFPTRTRGGARCLVPFRLNSPLSKRILKLPEDLGGGIIEVLADGQQFIAHGTHVKSGSRYEWYGDWPNTITTITLEAFEAICVDLQNLFPGSSWGKTSIPAKQNVGHRPPHLSSGPIEDPVAIWLQDTWSCFGTGNGKIHIRCPWSDEHSCGTDGDTSTSWLFAGTNGYQHGRFKCLHAHCADRTNAEFFAKIRPDETLDKPDLSAMPDKALADGIELWGPPPSLQRNNNGQFSANEETLSLGIAYPPWAGVEIGFDNFASKVMTRDLGCSDWTSLTDECAYTIRRRLRVSGYNAAPKETIRDAINELAMQRQFDSAKDYLHGLKWDGVPRIDGFCVAYLGSEPGPYACALGRYLWTALAGRVEEPGVKADMMPVLVGEQGGGKSTAIRSLALKSEWYTELSFGEKDADFSRRIIGKSVIEISELKGLQFREAGSIKDLLSRQEERWIPKYQEAERRYPRRCLMIGSTNEDQFLADATGERRWLPLHVGKIDVEAILRDREQLWAEALVMFIQGGVDWSVEKLATKVHEQFKVENPWIEMIEVWLDRPIEHTRLGLTDAAGKKTYRQRGWVTVWEVGEHALDLRPADIAGRHASKIGSTLREMGFIYRRATDKGRQRRWCVPSQIT